MTRVMLIIVIAIQLLIAMQSEGLIRALSELSAFLTIVMLVLTIKRGKSGSSGHSHRTEHKHGSKA